MKTTDFRAMANALRKAGDIADRIQDNIEDETLDKKEKEEKEDTLLAEFMVQMMKIQGL